MTDQKIFEEKFYDLYLEQNKSLNILISNILLIGNNSKDRKIYDNCFGLGGIFFQIISNSTSDEDYIFYGNEINLDKYNYFEKKSSNFNNSFITQNSDFLYSDKFSSEKFDYLVNDPPLGLKVKKDLVEKYKNNTESLIDIKTGDYIFLVDLINKSKKSSRIVSIITSSFLSSTSNNIRKIREYIIKNDMIESIIRLPEGAYSGTGIPTYILVLDRNKQKKNKKKILLFNSKEYFIKGEPSLPELSLIKDIYKMEQTGKYRSPYFSSKLKQRFNFKLIDSFLENYSDLTNSENKIIIDSDDNLDSIRFDYLFKIRNIKNNIKDQESLKYFSSIVEDSKIINLLPIKKERINSKVRDYLKKYESIETESLSNSNYVFFPTMPGPKTRVRKGSILDLEKYRYIAVKLKNNANAQYVCDFYNSEIGKDFINALSKGDFAPSLSLSDIPDLPYIDNKNFDITNKNSKVGTQIADLIRRLSRYDDKLLEDPNVDLFTILNKVLPSYNLYDLISNGESDRVEFKATFSTPIEDIEKYEKMTTNEKKNTQTSIETASLKTITGFLNAKGGELLIGVTDAGNEILGIESDKHESQDKHSLYLIEKIEHRIGVNYAKYIDIIYEKLEDKTICRIQCKSIKDTEGQNNIEPAPLKDKDSSSPSSWRYYTRTAAKTKELLGRELVEFMNNS